jgi:predicted unusual protein kinase regulating ubiquinone biosynthesis (AarF/ABC1/UbiB family)
MSFFCKLFSHIKLIHSLWCYYGYCMDSEDYDSVLLDNVLENVSNCGAVMIKFCQWITPKLELIHLETSEIIENNKPEWLNKLENFYEKCPEHDIEYTKEEYIRVFNENIEEKYEIIETIGSGSIGQAYLINDKKINEHRVLKILHPNVGSQIVFFKWFIKFWLLFPCIRDKTIKIMPIDIFNFIDQFLDQTNLVNEANNILHFERFYENNEYIVIPTIYKISETILIMSYEPGVSIDDEKLNDYKINKFANLYHLFVRENQMIENFNHGDLHPGNWRVRVDDNECKIVIYDFGFCWKQDQSQFDEMGDLMTDTFESSNRETNEVSLDNLCKIMYYAIIYDKRDKDTEYTDKIREFTNTRLKDLEPWKLSPIVLLKAIIEFCRIEGLLIDPTLLQGFIIIIQGQKLFERYELMASDDNLMDDYKVFRERYLNIYTFCKTYNIFQGYSDYIEKKLNKKQVHIGSVFDTIDINDLELHNMALSIKI